METFFLKILTKPLFKLWKWYSQHSHDAKSQKVPAKIICWSNVLYGIN
jgi:hypothetical protein